MQGLLQKRKQIMIELAYTRTPLPRRQKQQECESRGAEGGGGRRTAQWTGGKG